MEQLAEPSAPDAGRSGDDPADHHDERAGAPHRRFRFGRADRTGHVVDRDLPFAPEPVEAGRFVGTDADGNEPDDRDVLVLSRRPVPVGEKKGPRRLEHGVGLDGVGSVGVHLENPAGLGEVPVRKRHGLIDAPWVGREPPDQAVLLERLKRHRRLRPGRCAAVRGHA